MLQLESISHAFALAMYIGDRFIRRAHNPIFGPHFGLNEFTTRPEFKKILRSRRRLL